MSARFAPVPNDDRQEPSPEEYALEDEFQALLDFEASEQVAR